MLGTKRQDDFEPYWQDEKDWLCIVEFLPTDNPEARLFAADIIGYLVGYANLTNIRSLVCIGIPQRWSIVHRPQRPTEINKEIALTLAIQASRGPRWNMKTSTKDKLKGSFHEMKGTIKEEVGKITNARDLKAEGKAEKKEGKVQQKIGHAKEAVADLKAKLTELKTG